MCEPFETYVKLWEAVSGDKSRCLPEMAACHLKTYFTGEPGEQEEGITVILLDEIDYLVTQKQTVSYIF